MVVELAKIGKTWRVYPVNHEFDPEKTKFVVETHNFFNFTSDGRVHVNFLEVFQYSIFDDQRFFMDLSDGTIFQYDLDDLLYNWNISHNITCNM